MFPVALSELQTAHRPPPTAHTPPHLMHGSTLLSSPEMTRFRELAKTRAFGLWLFLSLLYGQLTLALLPSWSDGTYYDYGFLVPFLAPLFFLTHWKESGPGSERLNRSLRGMTREVWLIGLVFLSLVIITLLRLVQGADSGWRTPLYLHALTVLGITFVLLFRLQGKSAIRYWSCAIVVLLAVPLPSKLEFSLIHSLTAGVMEFALFANRMMGLPLASSGETIFANGIPLHVSDGCSGIRSFQSGVFAGFVLGEFLRLSLFSRLLLVACSLGLAFLMNGSRVIYLVQHAVAYPDADLQKVHDISGYLSLTLTFILIGTTGWLIGRVEKRVLSS
jgi:exosortase/archaeosortase family protein